MGESLLEISISLGLILFIYRGVGGGSVGFLTLKFWIPLF